MQNDEATLPALLAQDVKRYFPHLVLQYQQRLSAFLVRQIGNHQDAEDIMQEAFLRAYFALNDYLPERIATLALRPWLYKIALNISYSLMRKATVTSVSLDFSEAGPHLIIEDSEARQPDVLFLEQETLQELETLVSRLPEPYRAAINCYYFEELRYQEIADLLNLPIGTVKTHLHRGIRLLRASLQAQRNGVR